MGLKNRLAKLIIDPAFRHPGMLRAIFAVDDAVGIDFIRALAPFKMMPASRELFSRCFAHFVAGEHISLRAATELSAIAPDERTSKYLLIQADEERHHLEHFQDRLAKFGLLDDRLSGFVSSGFNAFGTRINAAVAKGDFVAGVIGNNIIVEGIAIVLLTVGCRSMRANSDEISAFMDFVLEDEQHHIRFGERVLKRLYETDAIDMPAAETFTASMWETALQAIDEIPDVLEAMDLGVDQMKREMAVFFRERLAPSGLAHAI